MLTMEEFREANERSEEQRKKRTICCRGSLRQEAAQNRSCPQFEGLGLLFSRKDREDLKGATRSQLEEIEITPMADAIDFPQLDVRCSLPGMLQGHFGSRK